MALERGMVKYMNKFFVIEFEVFTVCDTGKCYAHKSARMHTVYIFMCGFVCTREWLLK